MKIYSYDEVRIIPKKWISVTDALPPIGEEVVVFVPRKIETGHDPVTALARYIRHEGDVNYYWDNDYSKGNMHIQDAVTMWQPMPDVPNT